MAGSIARELVTKLSFVFNAKALDNFKKKIEGIKKGLSSFVDEIKSFAKSTRKLFFSVAGLFSTATFFANFLGGTERKLEGISRLAGISKNSLESLRIAFNSVGVSTDNFQNLILSLGDGLQKAKLGYGPLLQFAGSIGFNLKNSNGQLKQTDELLLDILDYARKIKNTSQQAYFLEGFLGKLDPATIDALLSKTSEQIKSIATESQKLQANISSADKKELEDFQKNFTEFKEVLYKWATEATLFLLPTLNSAISKFVEFSKKINDLRVYFDELSVSISNMLDPITKFFAKNTNLNAASPTVSKEALKNLGFASDSIQNRSIFGAFSEFLNANMNVPIVNNDAPIVNNITVNTTVPAGTTTEQEKNIKETSEVVYYDFAREFRQMINSNKLEAY